MLVEATNRAKIIQCDESLHIQGSYTNKIYSGCYDDINPFFSESKAKHLNSYAAIAKAHGEPELASKILDALLMPFPDKDTIYALTDSRLLDDLLLLLPSPFRSEMFDDLVSKEWYVLSDIDKEEDEGPTKLKKFFL
ncbi:hypothetical protein DFJ58DRAFT_729330 [Suillus subalutaceus]|uniref:uncharacterized protein n=1 Tax=Suillus subalutaceus TaxID=48586 RepID=UPI001B88670F|nr:uncharacterized protein DFJ58DRAFT_729330 [Suillus subalutaceus]KAG1850234.1 hypothetical protein DFJ58DRAFT_729330 [Suillus subalutaceus]